MNCRAEEEKHDHDPRPRRHRRVPDAHRRQAGRGRPGKRFDNINPATEEVLGETADAGHDDMDRAIAAARRAFDETDWSTDRALRKRCLVPAAGGARGARGAAAGRAGRRGGDAGAADLRAPARRPAGRGAAAGRPGSSTSSPGSATCPRATAFGMRSWRKVVKEPVGVVGAIVPWNYPFEVTINKLGQALATGQHGHPQGGSRHAVERHPHRPAGGRADRHPRRRAQRGHHHRTTWSARSWSPIPGWTDLLHRFDGGGPADHGEGRRRRSSGSSSSSGASRPTSSSTTPTSTAKLTLGVGRVHPRRPGLRHARPGCCCPGPATTKGSAIMADRLPERPLRRPDRSVRRPWAP